MPFVKRLVKGSALTHAEGDGNIDEVVAQLALKAPLASPALTGTPTSPTAAPGTNTTQLATTAFVDAAVVAKAPLASPALTGTPTAPTAAPGTNTTQLSTTAFVKAALDALIAGAPGALDTLNELSTALGADANFATTVTNSLAAKAPLASPTLTGTPVAPTAAPGTDTTQVATTAFVKAAADAKVQDSLAASATVAPSADAVNAGLAAKADYRAPRVEAGTAFTLTAANHSNTRTDCTSASAVTVTWNTGHGMVEGDTGLIVQGAAGAVTVVQGTGTLALAPNVAAAVTTGVGSWLSWEYMGDNAGGTNKLLITGAGVASSGGHVIEDEGTPVTQRANMNFTGAGVSVADAGGKTVVTIPGGGAGAVAAFTNSTAFTTLPQNSNDVTIGTIKIAGGALPAKGQAILRFRLRRTGGGDPVFFVKHGSTVLGTYTFTGAGGYANQPNGELFIRGNGTTTSSIFSGNAGYLWQASRDSEEVAEVTVDTTADWVLTLTGTTQAGTTLECASAVVEVITPQALA